MSAETIGATGRRFVEEIDPQPKARRVLPVRMDRPPKENPMPKVCSYCKGYEKSVEHSRSKDCPRYQAWKRKKKGTKGARGRSDSPRRRGRGAPGGFESTLARLKAKRSEIDTAIVTLEAVEGLLT